MTAYLSDKTRAVVLSALMVLSVFGGTVAFSGTAAADDFQDATISSSTSAASVDRSSSAQVQSITITNNNGTSGTLVEIDNFTVSATGGSSLTASDVQQISLSADGSTVASNSSFSSLNNVVLEIDSGGSSSSATSTDGDGDNELTIDAGQSETVNVSITTTSSADADGDTLQLETTTNLLDSAASQGDDVVIFSGPSTTSTDTSGTLTLSLSSTTNSPRGVPLDSNGNFIIGDGDRVFQGQDAIVFEEGGSSFETLTGANGDAEGQVLDVPIPEDQQVGTYTNGGEDVSTATIAVTVDQPRITDFEVLNQNDEDILGGSVADTNADDLEVVADYNYNRYEQLEVTVLDDGDLEVQGDVIKGPTAKFPDGTNNRTVRFGMDLSDQDAGSYTVEVAGADELDFGSATDSGTLELTSEDNVGIDLSSTDVTQGDNVQYEITGSVAGDFHIVTIDSQEFRDSATATQQAQIFRNVQDTEERGIITSSDSTDADDDDRLHETNEIPSSLGGRDITAAYAIVSIDDGTGLGVGSIDTTALDDSSITVDVSDELNTTTVSGDTVPAQLPASTAATPRSLGDNTGGAEGYVDIDGDVSTDDVDINVQEGEVTLDSPGNTYVVGSDVTLNGTAPTGIDDVAIYARDEGDFELVEIDDSRTVSVDADGGFEEEDVVLSEGDGDGNDILSLPGSYRIGVIDATDADTADDSDEAPDDSLTTSEFNSGTSSQRSIRVLGQGLNAEFTSVIRGQIAEEDGTVDINGSAPGAGDVLFIAVGPRGNVVTQEVSVETDQTFEEEDISITGSSGLNKGAISLHVFSIGRDGVYGDTSDDLGDFQSLVDGFEQDSLTADQVRSRILDASVEAAGSDDLIVNQNARLVDAQTTIQAVYQDGNQASGLNPVAAGNTLVVEGQTNLKPDDNTITAELQNEDTSVGLASVEEWSQDGTFTMSIDTADAATGTYTLELDDGENTVTEEVELVESIETPTATPTEEDDTPTATDSPTPTATASPTPTEMDTEMDTETPTPTSGGGPGFGAVVALVALLAAALLATRRTDS